MERNWYTDYKVMPTMEEVEQGVRPAYSTQPAPQWKPQPSPADMRDRMNWRGKSLNFLQQYAPGSRTALSYVDPGLVNQFDKINAYSRQERQSDMGPIRRWVDDMKSGIEQTPGRLATMVATPPPAWPVLFAGEQAGEEAVNQGGWKNILKATDAEKMGAIGRTALSGVMGKLFSGASPTFSPNATSANLLKDALPAYARSVGSTIAKIAPVVAGQNALSAYEQGQLSDPQWMKDTALGLSTRTLPLIAGMQAVNYAKPLGQTYAVNKLMNERGLNRPAFAGPQWMPELPVPPIPTPTPALPTPYIYGWHGSPYRHTKYDVNMIGKAEGNHALGWGMPYISESRDVSRGYKEMGRGQWVYPLKENINGLIAGKILPQKAISSIPLVEKIKEYAHDTVYPPELNVTFDERTAAENNIDYNKVMDEISSGAWGIGYNDLNEMADLHIRYYNDWMPDIMNDNIQTPERRKSIIKDYTLGEIYKKIKADVSAASPNNPYEYSQNKNTLYKVKIKGGDKPHKFIAYDKTIPMDEKYKILDTIVPKLPYVYKIVNSYSDIGGPNSKEITELLTRETPVKGETIIKALAAIFGDKQASEHLYNMGYTGTEAPIKQFQGGSREISPDLNYVTYNPDDVEIVARYPKYPTPKVEHFMETMRKSKHPSGPVINMPPTQDQIDKMMMQQINRKSEQ